MPKYALARGARLREDRVRGGWVLLMAEQAVVLSETAVEILQLCREASEQEIVGTLQSRYPGEDLEGDVRDFLREAVQERWLRTL